MSEEIIKVLDYICAQLGVAVDWSAENVMPQAMDILGRYRVFQIVSDIFLLVVFIGLIFIVGCLLKKSINDVCLKKDGIWYDGYMMTGFSFALYIVAVSVRIVVIPLVVITISNTLEWIIIPEIKYLQMLKGLMA